MATISIADNDARVQYTQAVTANTTQLTIDFPFFDLDDINVIVTSAAGVDTTLSRGTGTGTFAVTGTSVDDGYSGGYITLGDTYSDASTTYTIFRDIPVARTTDFPTSGPFNIASLNTELDKVIAIEQELETRITRTLQLADSDTTVDLKLPNLDTRKGKTLAFNTTTGVPEAGPSVTDIGTIQSISTDIATLADIEDGTDATDAIQTVAGISSNVTTVAGISANVTTVAGISADVTSVAADATDIGTVATNISSVNTVATNIADVITVANDLNEAISEVETVANDLNEAVSEIDTVAGSISNVDTVGTNISNVNTVAGISANVTTVAGVSANVTTVAGISGNVTTVAGISADVSTVAADGTDIGTVAGSISNVNTVAAADSNITTIVGQITPTNNIATVAGDSANIGTVAGISSNVTTVAGISSNVTTVAGVSADVTTVAGQISPTNNVGTVAGISSDVTTAAGISANITTVAGISSNVTTVAGISGNVTTVAGISSDVTAVAADATDIGTVATDIANVNTVATNISGVNSFAERYRVASSDPATSLDAGDLAFNTTAAQLKYYDGSAWQGIAPGISAVSADSSPSLGGNLDTNGNNITFGDNDKAIFGAGSDLQIYHNGTDSFIDDAGTGDLFIRSNRVFIDKYTGERVITATADGGVGLYFDNSLKFDTTSTGIDVTGTVTADGLTVDTNTLHVDSTNNRVGIGTTGPATPLDVRTTSPTIRSTYDYTGTYVQLFHNGSNGYFDFSSGSQIWRGAGQAERMRIDASGNLLVSKTSANSTTDGIELRGGSGAVRFIGKTDGNAVGYLNRGVSDGDILQFAQDNTDHGSIGTPFTNALYITGPGANGSGLVFQNNDIMAPARNGARSDATQDLGSTAFRFKDLYLSGNANVGDLIGPASANFDIRTGSGTGDMIFHVNGSERARIDASGKMGIGQTPTTDLLEVNGDVRAVDFNATSDERLKSNIRKIENALDKVCQMNGMHYVLDGKEASGVIAQNVQTVAPEAVADEGEYMTVAYNQLIGYLIEAVKELKTEVEELKNGNASSIS